MPAMGAARIIKTVSNMSIAQMLELAARYIPAGWILAESRDGVIFGPVSEHLEIAKLAACQSIIIFEPEAEIRMEKSAGSLEGSCQCLRRAGDGVGFAVSQLASILGRRPPEGSHL